MFGIPAMKVNEWYLDGHSRLELPFGVVENEPKVDMAANNKSKHRPAIRRVTAGGYFVVVI